MYNQPLDKPTPTSLDLAPFVTSPNWSRQDLFTAAQHYMHRVLMHWGFPVPLFHDTIPRFLNRRYGSGGKHFGWYDGSVHVNVADSTAPVTKSNPRRFSYPGNKSDRTAAGIMAHECGHHVWTNLERSKPHVIRTWLYLWQTLKREPISGYEPTPEEGFAETMRLFALNPMLLKAGAPSRYVFITRDCGLLPPHEQPWQRVLAGAAPTVFAQVEKWLKGKPGEKGLL